MGLILPQTVKIRTNGNNCKHYKSKGYKFKKCGEFIEVDVLDLTKGSHTHRLNVHAIFVEKK